ncbi:hypothetical protein [Lentzea sp. NPDC092896]|uniref:hypothetical protein n=1 Tax=Lentzea sp. NPDC092896 TaxID=3364127 RepID=UPI0037FE94E5
MTAPDPLVCMDLLAAGQAPDCGEPPTAHCSSCKGCPDVCACPPLPAIGTQVMPKPGIRWHDKPMRQEPHTVVATWDYRNEGDPRDHAIVVQPTALVNYAIRTHEPVDTQYGRYLDLDDIELLPDQPRITFTAKENS